LLCTLGADARAADSAPVVILLSWDGTRYDYPSRVATVALARMAREGAHASRLTPVFPSSTFPNHVSLATGTYPDRHGIIENVFTDRRGRRFSYGNDASWIEAEPLWVAAERQNVRAAVYFWVGSESEWHGRAATYRMRPFDASVGEAEKVDQILKWLDLPDAARPGLVMSWWHGCDAVGHANGPNAPEIASQLLAQDRQLARLFAGLDARGAWAYATVIVASDHGMAEITGVVDAEPALGAAGIPARVEYSGGEGQVYLRDLAQRDAALAALAKVDGLEAYASERLPARLRSDYPGRSGDLTLLASPPNVLAHPSWLLRVSAAWSWLRGKRSGAHGFDPAQSDMGAIFYALGRGVPRGAELGEVRAIDVAPTIAALLGIEPPEQSEGKALLRASQSAQRAVGERRP
ncbi:MAG TPA: alkaline phosphatase family protein, partial [Myxococcota bacterium]|nr:alkaline phosphatase family protein [Myxococcota bacterium]